MSVTTADAKSCQGIFAELDRLRQTNIHSVLNYKLEETKNSKGNLLLIHGLGDDLTQLNHLASRFVRAGYSVLRVDLHGHGQNLGREAPSLIKYETNVKDVMKVLEHLDFKNPIAIGHSYGAAIAYALTSQLSANQRLRPSKLIMMAPYLRRLDYTYLTGNPILDAQVEYMSEAYMRQTFREYFHSRGLDNIDARINAAIATTKGIRSFDVLTEGKTASPEVQLKMLLMAGDKDQIATPRYVDSFHNKLKEEGYLHQFEIVKGDHFFPQENVEQTFRLILNFLKKE